MLCKGKKSLLLLSGSLAKRPPNVSDKLINVVSVVLAIKVYLLTLLLKTGEFAEKLLRKTLAVDSRLENKSKWRQLRLHTAMSGTNTDSSIQTMNLNI